MARIELAVAPVVSLGAPPGQGERRYVCLGAGTVSGPELQGAVLEGGVDWHVLRPDGATEISAHYVIRTHDGALVEVRSEGLRHGPPEVMARLAQGQPVAASEYFFRTQLRFATGHPAWLHLNMVMALARGQREAARVLLDLWRIG
jgi:hypothetical protein